MMRSAESILTEHQMSSHDISEEFPQPKVVRKRNRNRRSGPENEEGFADIGDVDDTTEAQQRLAQRVVDQHHAFQSPGTSTSVTNLQKQSSQSGLTAEQITEHYKSCLELHARNKITSKNAFELRLIECLPQCVKSVKNFQSVSTAVEAASKIYAYRVDAVHQEMQKVSGGFNRMELGKPGRDDSEDEGEHTGDTPPKAKKAKRVKASKPTIEINEKNINMTANDVEYEDDPLFRKICSNYDEGGLTGLLLNQVRSCADGRHLMLHTLSEPKLEKVEPLESDAKHKNDIVDLLKKILDGPEEICPSLADFQFTKWSADEELEKTRDNIDDEDSMMARSTGGSPQKPSAFQAVLRDEQSFREDVNNIGLDIEMNDDNGSDGFDEPPAKRFPDLEQVHNLLSSQPLDYGYFDQSKMDTYKGPSHWKMRKNKDDAPQKKPQRRVRAKRELEEIDFDISADLLDNKYKSLDNTETTLAGATVQRRQKMNHLLDDEFFDTLKFKQLSFPEKVGCMGRFGRATGTPTPEEEKEEIAATTAQVPPYDYDNPNDSQQFCADVTAGSDGFDVNEPAENSQENEPSTSAAPDNDCFIPEPKKVQQIKVEYAKRQKKIDARKIKKEMWEILAPNLNEERRTSAAESQMEGATDFGRLCQNLPERLSQTGRHDLSVPIAFVMFLHLCNEHTLQLNQTESGEMDNFIIEQG